MKNTRSVLIGLVYQCSTIVCMSICTSCAVKPHSDNATVAKKSEATAPEQQEANLLTSVHQLTFAGLRSGEGYFSADGSSLIFQSERDKENPFYQMFLLDLRNGESKRVSDGVGKTTCGWIHPNGQSVLYSSTHLDPASPQLQKEELETRASGKKKRYSWDYDPSYDIFVRDLSSNQLTPVTTARGYDAEASWSPDGSKIVFASNRLAYSQALSAKDTERLKNDPAYFIDLYLMNADGSGVVRLTDTPGYDGGPFFSADGKKITWRRFSADGATAEIFTMNSDGSAPKQLTHLGAMSWAPFFHPSGEYLVFTTNLQGFDNFELYLVRADGKDAPVRITYTPGFDGLPVYSPDGNTLSWTSTRGEGKTSQLFLARWNDTEARRLLDLPPGPVGTTQVQAPSSATSEPEPASAIRVADLKQHIETLASDEMLGRLTGTLGEKKATAYAADLLREYGFIPFGNSKSFIQHFTFTSGVSLGAANHLNISGTAASDKKRKYKTEVDWLPLAFSSTGVVQPTGVVFGGYGIVAPALTTPEGEKFEAYNSYVHLDVKDKWVLLLRQEPSGVPEAFRKHLSRHASLRYKAMMARELGARGIIVASGPNSEIRQQIVPLEFDAAHSQSSIAAISVSNAVATELFDLATAGTAKTSLEAAQQKLDRGESMIGFPLAGLTVAAEISLVHEQRKGQNVIAVLPASPRPATLGPIIVGAHIDHLGRGKNNSSLATADEQDQIHHGADDNASGVAAALEIAQHIADLCSKKTLTPARDLIIALWSGEELGLLGSTYFVQNYAREQAQASRLPIAAYLNMDMVGRLDRSLIIQGLGSSPAWLGEIERAAVPLQIAIIPQNDTYLPTDATSFYLQGVPILSAFTGAHSDYHTPRDTADKINYPGLVTVTTLVDSITQSLVAETVNPEYQKQDKPAEYGQRAFLRAYLGTIPDYSTNDLKGVRLAGVSAKGPAEAAGIAGGDIVIRLGGKTVENIYEYTYAIEALKPNETVEITVLRNGVETTLQVTPKSRE